MGDIAGMQHTPRNVSVLNLSGEEGEPGKVRRGKERRGKVR